jgi:hypothetical protein
MAKGYQSDPDFNNRQMGDALAATVQSMRNCLARTNPDYAAQLNNINKAFANLTVLQRAAAMQGAKDGIFSANQLSAAVKSGDKTVRDNAFARGNALMQDLSDAAKANLPSTVPDSGTAGRGFLGLGTAALLGGHLNPIIPPAAMAGSIAALPYTKLGGQLFQGLMTARPGISRTIGEQLTQNAGKLGLIATPMSQPIGAGLLK